MAETGRDKEVINDKKDYLGQGHLPSEDKRDYLTNAAQENPD